MSQHLQTNEENAFQVYLPEYFTENQSQKENLDEVATKINQIQWNFEN